MLIKQEKMQNSDIHTVYLLCIDLQKEQNMIDLSDQENKKHHRIGAEDILTRLVGKFLKDSQSGQLLGYVTICAYILFLRMWKYLT